jgi:bis(5'-nucleosidyl)-tetraphosphatase
MLSSGAVVVHEGPRGRRYLLLRAYQNWDFPKGIVEPGEDPLAAARREVREETGITDLEFPWGEDFLETPPYARGKVARYHLARTSTDRVDLGLNPSGRREHHEYRWAPYAEARALVVERIRVVLDWADRRIGSR